jgi:CSLREA domain-containing protein
MTTTKRYFRKRLALLLWAVLAAGVMMMVLASPAWAATYTVNSNADTNDGACTTGSGGCTLREAINAANASSGVADTIDFDLGSSATITLSSTLPTITDSAGVTIDGENNLTVVGTAGSSTAISNAGTLTVSNSTFAGTSANIGGAISNAGNLTVNNSTFFRNAAKFLGAGIYNNGGTVTVNNSTFFRNQAAAGGGIYNENGGTVTVSNSTLSENVNGAGIFNFGGTVTVSNSTITGNSDVEAPGGINNSNNDISGDEASVTLKNTIVANNTSMTVGSASVRDCGGTAPITAITDEGYNLSSDNTCGFSAANHSQSGTADNPLDPKLGPLAENGGPTQTHALLTNSPAIDAGPPVAADVNGLSCPPPAEDQRGVARPQDGDANGTVACDIGAFELQLPALSIDDAKVAEGNSGTSNATFTASLSKASTQTVTVNYATADDTAIAGTDYEASSDTLSFAPGTTSQSITVPVIGDNVDESDEGFFVNLRNATNATISDARGIGTITDDDPPPDTTPPSVTCRATPNRLVLPANNHKLVTITASVQVSDENGSGPDRFELVSVESNQADSGLGPGDVPNDIQGWTTGTNDTSGQLRAERYGFDRIYTLTYEGYDKAGNKTSCSATVTVPKPTKKG